MTTTSTRPITDVHGLCAHLGITRQKSYELIARGMPFLDLGPRIRRFDLDAVDEWAMTSRASS